MRKAFLMLATTCGLCLIALPAQASLQATTPAAAPSAPAPPPPATDPVTGQIQAIQLQQQQIAGVKASLTAEVSAAHDVQSGLTQLIGTNQKTIVATNAQLDQTEQKYHDATAAQQRFQAEADAAHHRALLDKQILALTLHSRFTNQSGDLAFLFAGSTFTELVQRADALSHVVKGTSDLIKQVTQDEAEAHKAETQAADEAHKAAAAAANLQAESDQLKQQVANEKNLVGQLSSQTRAAGQEIVAADNQNAALAQQIADLRIQQLDSAIAAAEGADWQAANFYLTNDLGALPGAFTVATPGGKGQFVWPARPAAVSQGFGPSPYPMEPAFGGYPHFHTGIDLAAAMGTPVMATGDGVVVAATNGSTGYGNHIIIAHGNNVLSLYGHLEQLLVTTGQTVHQGQLIGLLGSTGNSTGPHLHFEVRVQNQPIDPVSFLPALPPGSSGPG